MNKYKFLVSDCFTDISLIMEDLKKDFWAVGGCFSCSTVFDHQTLSMTCTDLQNCLSSVLCLSAVWSLLLFSTNILFVPPLSRNQHRYPETPADSERSLWMTWIINSVVVLQTYRDLCDVIFMSSSLICCWMSVRGEPQLVGGFIYRLTEQLKAAVWSFSRAPPNGAHLLPTSTCWAHTAIYSKMTLCCRLQVREDWRWAPEIRFYTYCTFISQNDF